MNDTLRYQVVFDVASHGYTTWHTALVPAGVAIVAAGLYLIVNRMLSGGEDRELRRYQSGLKIIMVVMLVGTVGMLVITWDDYAELRSALARHAYRVVTGTVTDFVPEGPDGHPTERFRVDGAQYAYSTYDITSAFHLVARNGGPIHNGVPVRISEVRGSIARLEIAR